MLCVDQLVSGSAVLRTRVEGDFKEVIAEFADSQTQPSVPVPAPVLDMEPAEPTPKKKRLLRLEERCEACVRVAAGGGGDSGSAEPQAVVTGQRVLIGRGVLVYLTEQGQLDVDAFNLLRFGNRRGTDKRMLDDEHGRVSGGNAISGVYRSVVPWDRGHQLSGRAILLAFAYLIRDLRSSMLASKVERMVLIRLKRHLIDEGRELDAAVAQARARVAKSAH